MEEIKPRIGPDGKPVKDVSVNPFAVERKQREAEDRARREEEGKKPWSREKVEKEIARAAQEKPMQVIDGIESRSHANFHGADLSGLDLSGLDLSYVNMHGAKLIGANLSGCRLIQANLAEASMTGAVLDKINAVEANLSGACLCASKANKAQFMGANLSECCFEANEGIDIVEKPLTVAEEAFAKYKQSEGFRVNILHDEKEKGNARVLYIGATLEKANVTGMRTTCRRKEKAS
jgi:hypothetical protein